jgi:hypothetical protein
MKGILLPRKLQNTAKVSSASIVVVFNEVQVDCAL